MTLRQITELCQTLTVLNRLHVDLRNPTVNSLQTLLKKLSAHKPEVKESPPKRSQSQGKRPAKPVEKKFSAPDPIEVTPPEEYSPPPARRLPFDSYGLPAQEAGQDTYQLPHTSELIRYLPPDARPTRDPRVGVAPPPPQDYRSPDTRYQPQMQMMAPSPPHEHVSRGGYYNDYEHSPSYGYQQHPPRQQHSSSLPPLTKQQQMMVSPQPMSGSGSQDVSPHNDRQFMSALSALHGGPTAQEQYMAELKRKELVLALDEQVREKAARKERERRHLEQLEREEERIAATYNPYHSPGNGAPLVDRHGRPQADLREVARGRGETLISSGYSPPSQSHKSYAAGIDSARKQAERDQFEVQRKRVASRGIVLGGVSGPSELRPSQHQPAPKPKPLARKLPPITEPSPVTLQQPHHAEGIMRRNRTPKS